MIKIWILMLPLFTSNRVSGEKLIKYQAHSSYVILSVILMSTMFYKALILQGEIWCWSLLGFNGWVHIFHSRTYNDVIHFKGLLIRFQVTGDLKLVGRELNKNY